jgi:hypothetical protein
MVKFSRWNRTSGADDEIFLELAQASVGSGFLTANAMATMIYDIPALPGLIQKLDILCNVALKVIKEFSYIDRHPPEALSFWMTPS